MSDRMYTMRQARDIIEDEVLHPLQYSHSTIYLEGQPGIGKTALNHAIYAKYRRYETDFIKQPVYWRKGDDMKALSLEEQDGKGWIKVNNIREGHANGFTHFVPYVCPEREPTEWGLPMPNKDRTAIHMMPLDEFLFTPDDRVYFLCDEIDKANNMMQNVMARLAHEHTVYNVHLGAGSVVIMAGNRITDRAGGFNANTHIKNRRTHIPVGVDHKEFIEDVGIPFGLHPAVISFIRTDPKMLNKFSTTEPSYPSCRSWTKVGERLNHQKAEHVERALVEGDVGVETANLFWGHLKIHRELRSPEVIIRDPDNAAIPTGSKSVAIMWAEITSLARHAEARSADAIFRYFNRLPAEYSYCGYKDVLIRDRTLVMKSKSGQAWMVKNAAMLHASKAVD